MMIGIQHPKRRKSEAGKLLVEIWENTPRINDIF
jgi:hypothetical protein